MTNLVGKTWGSLTDTEQEIMLRKSNCVDTSTCNNAIEGQCVVDFEEVSIEGLIVNFDDSESELVIDTNAVFYDPTDSSQMRGAE